MNDLSPEGDTRNAGDVSPQELELERALSPEDGTLCDNDRIASPSGLVVSIAFQNRWLTPPAVLMSPSGLKTTAMLEQFSGLKKRGQSQIFNSPVLR